MIRRTIRILVFLIWVGLLTLTLVLSWNPPTIAQVIPDLNWSEDSISPESYIPVFTVGNLEVSPVFLDGKMLGTVESFIKLQEGDSQTNPYGSATRSLVIHSTLQKILDNYDTLFPRCSPPGGNIGTRGTRKRTEKTTNN